MRSLLMKEDNQLDEIMLEADRVINNFPLSSALSRIQHFSLSAEELVVAVHSSEREGVRMNKGRLCSGPRNSGAMTVLKCV